VHGQSTAPIVAPLASAARQSTRPEYPVTRAPHQAASLTALTGRALTIFRAGLALNTVGSLVKGLIPFRSLVAGFLRTTNFAKPGTMKELFFFNSL